MHRFGLYLSYFLAVVVLFLGMSARNPFSPISYPGYFVSASERAKLGELPGIREVPLGLGRATMSIPKGVGEIVIQSTVLTATPDCIGESGFPLRLVTGRYQRIPEKWPSGTSSLWPWASNPGWRS